MCLSAEGNKDIINVPLLKDMLHDSVQELLPKHYGMSYVITHSIVITHSSPSSHTRVKQDYISVQQEVRIPSS